MNRMSVSSCINKTQRESHSEIERKRRERMKRDTEFLRKQISNSHCKDKLSIFQAAAECLILYTDQLGKREYIINDEEYSRLILERFDGFDIHVRCSDGKILHIHPNVERILGISPDNLLEKTLYELAEPSVFTRQILNEALYCSEIHWDIFKGLIARNFILALHCTPSIPMRNCIHGSDDKIYRFIEFCGDLLTNGETDNPVAVTFRGICRSVDPFCETTITNDVHVPYFILRLSPGDFSITEAIGEFQSLLGYNAEEILGKRLRNLVAPSFQQSVEQTLNEVKTRGSLSNSVQLLHSETHSAEPFDMKLSAIRLGGCIHHIVCRLTSVKC